MKLDALAIIEKIAGYELRTATEHEMQSDLARVLEACQVEFRKEVQIDAANRFDFLVGSVVIECKIQQSKQEVLRQLARYAQFEEVTDIILLTTRASHRSIDGLTLNGKRVYVHWVMRL